MSGAGAQIALTTNLSRWMLVPSSMVNLDGSQCNMVGTGYTAFANQAVCHKPLYFIVIQAAYLCMCHCQSRSMQHAVVLHCVSVGMSLCSSSRSNSNSPLNPRYSFACFMNGKFGWREFVRHGLGLAEQQGMMPCLVLTFCEGMPH